MNPFARKNFRSTISRRHALKVGGLGLLGFNIPGILRALEEPQRVKPRAKSVIFLFQ